MTTNRKNGIFWIFAFLVIVITSQDFLFTEWSSKPTFLGFPSWIFYFMFLQILFIAIFQLFTKKYWTEEKAPENQS